MSNLITVIAATLDDRKLTLYKPDGTTVEIKQGDARVAQLVPIIMPEISAGRSVEVDLTVETNKSYAKYEENTNGFVRFFRVARSKLKEIFSKGEAAQKEEAEALVEGFEYTGQKYSQQAAVEEIMANAVPASNPAFEDVVEPTDDHHSNKNEDRTDGDTVVAVIDGKTVLPDAHYIKHQIDDAVENGSTGVTRFFERMAAVADKRRHSAQDLMKFCQKGDLHFADDGSILIYKALRTNRIGGKQCITDIHSGNVPQDVGSHVFMAESLVDPNRSNECSNGLHVARRQYVGSFSGDVLALCKVAPEDVIAVPNYDANKMRVCGYHILFRLNETDRQAIRNNRPIETEEGKKILAACIKGDHVGILQTVEIRGHKGTDLLITNLVDGVAVESEYRKSVEALSEQKPVEALNALDRTEAPRGAVLDLKEVEAQAEAAQTGSRRDQAESLYQAWVDSQTKDGAAQTAALAALLDFKKRTKVGWDKLGVPNDGKKPTLPTGEVADAPMEVERDLRAEIEAAYAEYLDSGTSTKYELDAIRKLVSLWDEDSTLVLEVTDEDVNEDAIDDFKDAIEREDAKLVPPAATTVQAGSKAEKIRNLINLGLTRDRANQIVALKKGAKKGWDKLHVSDAEAEQIEYLAD